MKRYLFLLFTLLLFAPSVCLAGFGYTIPNRDGSGVESSSECDGALVCQNFEGTGYDNSESWTEYFTEASGIINEDYTSAALRGTYSLLMDGETYKYVYDTVSFTANSSVYIHILHRTATDSTDSIDYLVSVLDSSDNVLGSLQYVPSNDRINLVSGGVTDYGSTDDLSVSTTYHLWIDYIAGSGSDGTFSLYIGTTITKPASPTHTITTSSSTADAAKLRFGSQRDGEFIRDQVIVKSTSFSSVDS